MHIVRDGFAPPELVRSLSATWLSEDSGHWHKYENGKLVTKDSTRLPTAAIQLLQLIAVLPIESLLGIPNTFPDLEYLHGAGLHQINSGGSLGLHLDSERHPILPWRREASAVLYIDDVEGGELEFCNETGATIDSVEPQANRLVLFGTAGQWHRVAQCISIRRSLCLFFWSLGVGDGATTAIFAQEGYHG